MRITILILFLLVQTIWPCAGFAADAVKLKTAWIGESEAFPVWLAKQKGLDREYGLDIEMLRFASGTEIIQGLLAYEWTVAGCGVLPAITSALSDRISIVAVANDEAAANEIVARPDSPVLQGKNPGNPDIYGSAESARGLRIVCPKGTSAHYLLNSWLRAIGLKGSDIRLIDMPPTKGLGAFAGGFGDLAVFWSPQSLGAEDKNFKKVASGRDLNILLPVVLVANDSFARQSPHLLEAFLKMYFQVAQSVNDAKPEDLVGDYRKFFKEWAGQELAPADALKDLRTHKLFTLADNLKLFEPVDGISPIQKELDKIAAFASESLKLPVKIDPRTLTDIYLKNLDK